MDTWLRSQVLRWSLEFEHGYLASFEFGFQD